ncbi:MAG: hypothetical protein H7062_08285 [Candidatus Saccharimonas sp.]|nr:hypothetical protein [Planctomycetaceae bacterium]
MFGILSVLFVVVFVFVFATILIGAFRTMSMSGKVFQVVERQLDEQLSRSQNSSSDEAAPLQCAHCGSAVRSDEKCPNCGASLV